MRPFAVYPLVYASRRVRIRVIRCEECSSIHGSEMPKSAFYAVHSGKRPGIYLTWAEAEAQVKGFQGAKFKKFHTEAQARDFLKSPVDPYARPATASEAGPSTSSVRDTSPPFHATSSNLPHELEELAKEGWTFSPKGRLVVYCDGSGLSNGQVGARAGLGVWWGCKGKAAESNTSERVPGEVQTNNRGELLAVIRALETCPHADLPLEIRTDSQYTIKCMTTYLPLWLKKGFTTSSRNKGRGKTKNGEAGGKEIKNLDLIKHLLVLLQRRKPKAGVRFKYVAGHSGVEGNEEADRLAKRGAMLPPLPDRTDWLDPDLEKTDDLSEDQEPTADIEVEVNEDWLMSQEELESFEAEIAQG